MTYLNNYLLTVGICLTVTIFLAITLGKSRIDRITVAFSKKNVIFLYITCMVAIACLAIFVRVYQFGTIPGGFNQDGAMAAVDAKALAEYGTDRFGMKYPVHLTAWGFGQMSSLLSYLMAGMIKLFGFSEVTVRLPLLLVSLAGLIFLVLFVYEVFGEKQALVAALIGAINPWHIVQSRWALDCNLYPHFLLFGLYFLQHALRAKRRKLFFALSMVSFGLSMYCYGVSIYTTTFFLLVALIYLICEKKVKISEILLSFAVYLLVAWPFLLTMAVNTFHWHTIDMGLFTIPYFENSVRSNDILLFSDHFGEQLAINLKSLLSTTLLQTKDLPWNDLEGFGTLYKFTYPFVFVGLIRVFQKNRKNEGAILLLCLLLAGIFCGILTASVNINRINCIYYPLMILAAFGISEVIQLAGKYRIGLGVIIVGTYLVAFSLFSKSYFGDYAASIRYYFFADFHDALKYVKDLTVDKYYITCDSQYQGARNVSEILTLFDLEIDAEYFQGVKEIPGELPYAEKYTYFCTGEVWGNPEENAAYVITINELDNFDRKEYRIVQFGNYYAVYQ